MVDHGEESSESGLLTSTASGRLTEVQPVSSSLGNTLREDHHHEYDGWGDYSVTSVTDELLLLHGFNISNKR